MIDPKTYEKALRAARNVARSSTRAAVGLGLLTSTGGCLSSGTTDAGPLADVTPDTSLADVTGDVVTNIVDAVMADIFTDYAALLDGYPVDAVTPPDAVMVDAVTPPDATDVLAEVIAGDADVSTDVAATCNCLMPTELACTGWQDYGGECKSDEECDGNSWDGSDMKCGEAGMCQIAICDYEEQPNLVCYGDVCHEPEGFGECCEAAYANADCMIGTIPGCTPWGPPAPSPYDGLTLADFGLA